MSYNKILKEAKLPTEYVIIDIETTGFKFGEDKIIEIAAVKYDDSGIIGSFETLVNPETMLPRHIISLTGITQSDVDAAPPLRDLQNDFINFIGDYVLVGHNIKEFDIPFINHALGKNLTNCLIDTLQLSKQAFPNLPNYNLKYLKTVLGIDIPGAHRAMVDVQATHELLKSCINPKKHNIEVNDLQCENMPRGSKYGEKLKVKDICPSAGASMDSVLRDKSIVFTGTLSIERTVAAQIAADAGAKVKSSVSKKTDYLVVGKQDVAIVGFDGMSDKEEKAHAINSKGIGHIEIIDEDTFVRLSQTISDAPIEAEVQTNPPTAKEISIYDMLKECCKDTLATLNVPDDFLILKGLSEKSAICLVDEKHVISYVKIRKAKNYISMTEHVLDLLPDTAQTYHLKSTPGIVYIKISTAEDVKPLIDAFMEAVRINIRKYHTFDCCGRYLECSNAKKCVHPKPAEALGCTYKRNLEKGLIFYGENSNID